MGDDQHVSVSHLRVLRKIDNAEAVELRLKQKWKDSLILSMKFYAISKQRHIKGSPHTDPKLRETLGIVGGG